jgi:hypothetical protein
MAHYKIGSPDNEVPWDIQSSVAEEMLVAANEAQQKAEALMAQQVVTRQPKHS